MNNGMVGNESIVKTGYGDVPVIPNVIVEPISEDFKMPTYASEGDSGMDVYATEDILIAPGATRMVKLGFKMDIPKHPLHDLGYRWEVQARPKSGNSAKTDLRVANAPGTIDNFYKGEVCILLTNHKAKEIGLMYDKQGDDVKIDLGVGISDYAINLKNARVLNDITNKDGNPQVLDGTYIIRKGDKVAQLVFNQVMRPMNFTIGKVGESDRGENGFGSDVGYEKSEAKLDGVK